MIIQKYNCFKRNKFVIVTASAFNLDLSNISTFDNKDLIYVSQILELEFLKEIADAPPINYIVGLEGSLDVKNTFLKHSNNGYLRAFNDDIIIMIACNDLSEITLKHLDIISDIISDTSCSFALEIKENILFPEYRDMKSNYSSNKLEYMSVLKRNKKNPLFNVCEYLTKSGVERNDDVTVVKAKDFNNDLKGVADRYSLTKSYLKELNPHLNTDALIDSDIIIIPRTVPVFAEKVALDMHKRAQFYKDFCDDIINSKEEM